MLALSVQRAVLWVLCTRFSDQGGHETIVKLLYDEIPLCMGSQYGAIELCIRFKRENMLLWILEYCSRHSKLETAAKSTCFPKSTEVHIPEASLAASYFMGHQWEMCR